VAAQDRRSSTSANAWAPRAPRGHPLWGHAREFDRDQLHYLRTLAREYGDLVPLRLFPYRVVFLNHPDLIDQVVAAKQLAFVKGSVVHRLGELLGRGLITSNGELWRSQRRLIQPAFHQERIAQYGAMMAGHAEHILDTWEDGQEREILHDMLRLTLGVVCKALFQHGRRRRRTRHRRGVCGGARSRAWPRLNPTERRRRGRADAEPGASLAGETAAGGAG
jgi:cytochrome P450